MNLRSLSDDVLIVRTKESIREEREATTAVLHHLREIERRMLYAKLGFASLIEYAIKELKYSESAAYRRVSAMRLLKEMPEIEEKIHSGELSLATVAQAQTHFRQTKTETIEEKKEVLQEIENLSSRACERVLAKKRGETEPPERHKPLADGKTQVTFVLDDEIAALLKEVQIELGRTLEMKFLVKEMAKLSLQVLRKRKSTSPTSRNGKGENARPSASKESAEGVASVSPTSSEKCDSKGAKIDGKSSVQKMPASEATSMTPTLAAQRNNISLETETAELKNYSVSNRNGTISNTRNESSKSMNSAHQVFCGHRNSKANSEAIPLPSKRAVWRRDNGRCQYRDPLSGRQCECTTYLQVEHVVPRAHGGSNELENLELLCRAHNTYRAALVFGPKYMKQFVASLR